MPLGAWAIKRISSERHVINRAWSIRYQSFKQQRGGGGGLTETIEQLGMSAAFKQKKTPRVPYSFAIGVG